MNRAPVPLSVQTVASWYDHHLLPTATVQHANSLLAAVPVAMETDDEASAKFCGPLHCHAVTSHRHVTGDVSNYIAGIMRPHPHAPFQPDTGLKLENPGYPAQKTELIENNILWFQLS